MDGECVSWNGNSYPSGVVVVKTTGKATFRAFVKFVSSGQTFMVDVRSSDTILNVKERIEAISKRTASGGGEIVKLLEKGSAFYAPGSAAAIMAESVLNDRRRLIPASCYLTGQYGLEDVYIGVPCIIGANGVENIFELDLTESELSSLQESGNFYKDQLKDVLGY